MTDISKNRKKRSDRFFRLQRHLTDSYGYLLSIRRLAITRRARCLHEAKPTYINPISQSSQPMAHYLILPGSIYLQLRGTRYHAGIY